MKTGPNPNVYPWRVSCPVCGEQVIVRPRAIISWEQDLELIVCGVEFLGPHKCGSERTR